MSKKTPKNIFLFDDSEQNPKEHKALEQALQQDTNALKTLESLRDFKAQINRSVATTMKQTRNSEQFIDSVMNNLPKSKSNLSIGNFIQELFAPREWTLASALIMLFALVVTPAQNEQIASMISTKELLLGEIQDELVYLALSDSENIDIADAIYWN